MPNGCRDRLPKVLNEAAPKQARNSLAKFKKRKSKPTSGSGSGRGDGQAEPPAKDDMAGGAEPEPPPATAKPASSAPTDGSGEDAKAPEPPPESELQRGEKERKLNLLFWMRVTLAVAAGAAATFVFADIEGEDRRWASIAFMIILFVGTVFVAKGMKMQLPSSDRKKIVTQGLGSYVFLYLFVWIVSYTLVNLESVQSGINL